MVDAHSTLLAQRPRLVLVDMRFLLTPVFPGVPSPIHDARRHRPLDRHHHVRHRSLPCARERSRPGGRIHLWRFRALNPPSLRQLSRFRKSLTRSTSCTARFSIDIERRATTGGESTTWKRLLMRRPREKAGRSRIKGFRQPLRLYLRQ